MLPPQWFNPFIQTKYFLRALGFELLNILFRHRSEGESPKAVLRQSRWIALSRCTIHILPSSVFLFLMPLNFSTLYIGPGFSSWTSTGFCLVLFQIGAKLLKTICVANLMTVVLHVLRHDLLVKGVPLGFVGAGILARPFVSGALRCLPEHCILSRIGKA